MFNPKVQHKKAVERNLSPAFEQDFTVKVLPKFVRNISRFLNMLLIVLAILLMFAIVNDMELIYIRGLSFSVISVVLIYFLIDALGLYFKTNSKAQIKNRSVQMLRDLDPTLSDLTVKEINLLHENEGLVNIVEIRSKTKDYKAYRVKDDSLILMQP